MRAKKIYLTYCWLLCFVGISISTHAQVQIKQIGKTAGQTFTLSDLQTFLLDNKSNLLRRVVVTATCKDDSGTVFEYDFPAIILENGLQSYEYPPPIDSASPIKFRNDYQKKYFLQHHNLPNGNYRLCYNATSKYIPLNVIPLCLQKIATKEQDVNPADTTKQQGVFPINSSEFNLNKPKPLISIPKPGIDYELSKQNYFKKLRKDFEQPNISFNGRASIGYNYNPSPSNSLYPSNFMNGEFTPIFKIYGIPLSLTVLYTYDVIHNKPFFNQFNLSFNKREFQQGMLARLNTTMEVSHPKGELNLGGMGVGISGNTLQTYGNNPYSLGSFNTFDKASIQKYRYDKESLLKYKDSLEWSDPSKVKNVDHLTEQLDFQNTMRIVEQQNAEEKKVFEDSLAKKDKNALNKIKDQESVDLLQKMKHNDWPDKPQALEEVMPLSKYEKLFYRVQSWSLGKSYFNYTPLSIMGVGVTGGDIALNFSKLYVQASAGVLDMKQSLWFQTDFSKQYIVKASRVGWGLPDRAHIHVIFLDFRSLKPGDSTSELNVSRPQTNTVVGTEAAVSPFKNFLLKIEYMKSFSKFSSNVLSNYSGGQPSGNDAVHFSSQYSLVKIGTDMTADMNRIGGDYYTAGNPYLRNDVFNYGFRWNQGFMGRQIMFHSGVRKEDDNLDNKNNVTTSSQRYDAGVSLLFKKLPTLSISYLPVYFTQRVFNESAFKYYGRAVNFNVSSSYLTIIEGHSLSSTALFTHSVNENVLVKPGLNLYTSMLCENFFITKTVSVRAILSDNVPANHNDSLKSFVTDISVTFPIMKKGIQSLGFKINQNPFSNQYFVYGQSSLQLTKFLSGSLYAFYSLKGTQKVYTPYQLSGNLIQVSLTGWW